MTQSTAATTVDTAVQSVRSLALWRIGWTVLTILLIEASSAAPPFRRALAISAVAVPAYVLFALLLMFVSGVMARTLNWQTPPHRQMRIADFDWPLLQWARSMVASHIVRVFAGALFRGSPIWTA